MMKRWMQALLCFLLAVTIFPTATAWAGEAVRVKLGDDLLIPKYSYLIDGKKIGLVTNQTGVNGQGKAMIDVLKDYPKAKLTAIYTPEHGLDGKAKAGEYVESYIHPGLGIPVYSLYGKTRMPTADMLKEIDVLLFDIQDIGARTYTYISTLQYCMTAAKNSEKSIVVLDRPNPLGGQIVDGPVLEDPYRSFVGVDTLPMAHGMTAGELARYFNRKIGADLTVVPMEGYTRSMIFQDTGLTWIASSPNIPDLQSVMGYMATGLGEGTGLVQRDQFKWIGGKGIDSQQYAELLNRAHLPGVRFIPETQGDLGGVRLDIVDPHAFNPAKTGIYALSYGLRLGKFNVPVSQGGQIVMFDKIMGTKKIGEYLRQGLPPQEIEAAYAEQLNRFKAERSKYLIYRDIPRSYLSGGLILNQKSYVPFRSVLTELGYAVSYDPVTRQVYAAKPEKTIAFSTRDMKKVYVNETLVDNPEVMPMMKDGMVYIPSQFIPWIEKAVQKTVGNTIQILKADQEIFVPAKRLENRPGKTAYLTFDDGPSDLTPKILDILKEHGVPATFFVIGKNIKGHEKTLQRAAAEGHAIGNHTYSHNYSAIYKNMEAFYADFNKGNEAIARVIGSKPLIFRFPGGSNNSVSKKAQDPKRYGSGHWIMEDLADQLRSKGFTYFDWNVSTGDASSSGYTAESAWQKVREGIKGKKEVVILSHDTDSKLATAKALPRIIELLKSEGYVFATLNQNSESYAFLKR